MANQTVERRLAAIFMADVAGYSRMMGADETATLQALQEHRFALLDPTIGQHQGRVVKRMGDGILVEFQSVSEAVGCALDLQRSTVKRNEGIAQDQQIRWRIGINLGEVIVQDGDIFGDGVNIAARLQDIAEPDGVCVSSMVFGHIEAEFGNLFSDIGAHEFKNIAKPLRVYHHNSGQESSERPQAFRPFIDMPGKTASRTTGGCLCGEVRYEANEKAFGSMLCQCRICQKFSGAPVIGGTTFRTSTITFTKGAPKWYRSSSIAERGFCSECGTSLAYRGTVGLWTEWIMLFTATLDEPEMFPPTYHLGVESAMPWLDIHDDLPR
ncbi:MAG: GFA family protein, partial [Pseudomonadota bacterium]